VEDPTAQRVRAILCSEPRGHADMYGGFITPPDDEDGDFGVLFWHKDGFSTACGHGTIALGVWAVESGRIPRQDSGTREVVIDVPSGRVRARVRFEGGEVADVTFVNVPSWVQATGLPVVTSHGPVTVDVAFGGAMYAVLPAAAVGLDVVPRDYNALISVGREIRDQLNDSGVIAHPDDERLSDVYGTIFTAPGSSGEPHHHRNVTVFADGEVDRSPCGSGTAARLAHLVLLGEFGPDDELRHESIIGTTFTGRVVGETTRHGRRAVLPEVTGTAYRVGSSEFTIDPRDDLVPGFVLR
jgi:proline racemase